jgi:hydrogenase nickel incorporation protein HypA/HybF
MHEVGLVEGIVEAVQRRAGDRPVARIKVRIGTLHRAAPGPMDQALEMIAMGTNLEGAALELIQVPVTSTCRACGSVTTGDMIAEVCPACGGVGIDHAEGDELTLESIEYAAAPAVSRTPAA